MLVRARQPPLDRNLRSQEWAGATFSRDGDWLFVNIQTPGVTFAITGPWHRGPL
jgi:secreted PhoX family phosphatase